MTTKVKLTVEQLHDGKKVVVCLADPQSGQVLSGTEQVISEAGGSAELYIHSSGHLVVDEVDGA